MCARIAERAASASLASTAARIGSCIASEVSVSPAVRITRDAHACSSDWMFVSTLASTPLPLASASSRWKAMSACT